MSNQKHVQLMRLKREVRRVHAQYEREDEEW